MPNNETPIPFDESRRGAHRRLEVKALGKNLAARVAGRLVDRPNAGRNNRNRRNTSIDLPTGGKPGTRRPTGSNFDPDNDGWVDEGTTRPRFIGTAEQRKLSSSRRRQQQAPQLRQPPLRETSQASKERQAAKPRVLLTTLSSGRRDVTQWKRVGNQKGSNAGGFYEDENGDLFYVKWPKENLQSETEVLANKLYELADVEVPDVQVAQDSDGAKVVISEVIPNIKPVGPDNATDEQAEELASNFIFDAWLSNWDSVLSSNSNLTPDGRLVRIDSGGALIFRAQGARKGARFGEEVGEIDTMRDSDITEAGYIFGRLTDDGLTEQARRLAKIDPRQVENLVRELVSDGAEAENLATILRARRTNILDRFGVADPYEGTSAGKLSSGQRKVTPELLERHRNTDYKYGDPSVIDGRPMRSSTRGWLSGLTGRQIANLLTPSSEEQAREMQADSILAQALFSAGTNMDSLSRKELQQLRERTKEQLSSIYGAKLDEMPDIEADYSEESTSAVRNMLSQAFIDVPGLLWAVQKFGAPPYLKSSQEGFRRRQEPNLLGTHVPGLGIMLSPPLFADGATGFDPQQPRKGDWMIDTSPSGVILHEWGHWFDSKLKTLSHFGSRSDSAYFSGQSSEQPKRGKFRLGRPKNEPMHPMLPSDHFDRSKFGEDTTDKTVSQQISSVLSDLRMLTSEESPFREMYETNRPLITETARLSQDGFDPSRYGFGMATGYGNASPTEMVAESFVAVLHPNPEIEKNFITTRLSRMVRNALGVSHDQNDRPWDRLAQAEQKKSSLSSGRRANRRDGIRRVLNRDEQSRRQERLSSGKREDGQPTGTGSKKLKLVPMDDPRITELVAADQRWRDYASRLSSIDEQELVRGAAYKEPQLPGMAPEIDPSSRQTRSHVRNTGPRYVSFTDPKGKEHLYMLLVDRDYYENIFAYSVDALLKQKKEFDEGINDGKKRWNGEFLPDFRYVGKGAVVGTLSGERPRALKGKPVEGKETYTIDAIEVKKAHTRRGIGSAMLKFHRDVFPEADMHHSRALSEDGRGFAGATPIETLTLASGRRQQAYKPLEKLIRQMDKDGSGWMDEDMRQDRLAELENMFGLAAREAVEAWFAGADEITYALRDEIESGKLSTTSRSLLDLVANSPTPRDPLFRGMRLSPEKLQELRDGKRVIFPLGATSKSKSSAKEFARDPGLSYDNGVMFEIEGAPAFPVHHFSPIDENEYLVSGEFNIVDEGIQVVEYGKQIPLFKLRKRESSLSSGRRAASRSDHLDIEVDPFIDSLKNTIERAIDKPDTEPESTFSIMRSLVDRMARAANDPTYDTYTERADEFISDHRQKFETKLESTFEKVRKSIYSGAPSPDSEDENTAIALVVEATMRSLLFELADNPDMPRSELTSLARRTLEQQDFAGIKGSTKMSPARVDEWMDGMDTDAIVEYAILHLQIKALRQWQDIGYIALRNYANCLAKGGSKNTCDTKMDSFVISGDIDARPDRSIGEPTEYMLTDLPIRIISIRPLVSQYAGIMNKVSKKLATKTDNSGIVYRGITKAPEDRQAAMLSPFFDTMVQNLKPGTVFSSSTFSGTSTSPYFATQFSNIETTSDSILFVIRTPKNTSYIAGSEYESELILQPNQRFRILAVSGGKMKVGENQLADKYIVEVEALSDNAEIDESGTVRLASGRRADNRRDVSEILSRPRNTSPAFGQFDNLATYDDYQDLARHGSGTRSKRPLTRSSQ